MARYKEFNSNRVLEKCIKLFWNKGYGSCAISEIVNQTGVNRFSLYEEFDNKDGILYSTINLYKERYSDNRIKILSEKGEIKNILKKFFLSYHSENGSHPPGCYIITVSTELGDTDPAVKESLRDYIEEIKESLSKLLLHGSLDAPIEFYVNQLVGLFCTSMSFSLIHSFEDRVKFIDNGLRVIFRKKSNYATDSI